eukprot:CAMPEP_0171971532 /NCGR_PEP_ID=MMETSP0993-20121228/218320_1 /TAXON_ID=483369 /ORGANISM="non described non described, Strain CCMP2098" /LENGTH=76 /DNA_ID=CAMNT_0012621885 /DNA_START=79 /DNA_END=309 /DNA_ORIENTATION=-
MGAAACPRFTTKDASMCTARSKMAQRWLNTFATARIIAAAPGTQTPQPDDACPVAAAATAAAVSAAADPTSSSFGR